MSTALKERLSPLYMEKVNGYLKEVALNALLNDLEECLEEATEAVDELERMQDDGKMLSDCIQKESIMATVTLSTKMSEHDKKVFDETAEALGMSSATALKIFVKQFNAHGGFPFEVKRNYNLSVAALEESSEANYNENGYTIIPKELDCEEDDVYDELYPNG